MNLGTNEIKYIYAGSTPVAQMYLGTTKVWPKAQPAADWLCFTAEQNGSTLRLDKVGSSGTIYLETSDDEGATWKDYTWSNNTGTEFTNLNVGDKVYMRAKTENQTIGSSSSNYYKFVMTGKIAASGNIQTLLNGDGSRTDAPSHCYSSMFRDCTSLTSAPELPATTLANNCYYRMFYGCSSLTNAPALPATTLASSCYTSMFDGCSSLTTAPALPATTLASSCYSGMFYGCTSLTTAPALPATTLVQRCYEGMFNGTSLTTAPKLPATTLVNYCYQYMFYNCKQLSSIEVAITGWYPLNGTANWVDGVAASGTFTCPAELPDERGKNKIPTGWTKVDAT